jgi:hypothetical protein
MAFVKLDTGILNSTLWMERDCREVFITALLMAEPKEFSHPVEQMEVRSMKPTGFVAPSGWYGFVAAAGIGIITRSLVEKELGFKALEMLGNPECDSRSVEFDGRRMIRVDGGFLILNYMKYRDRDHTAAERQRRLRERRKVLSNGVTSQSNAATSHIAESREQRAESREQSKPTPEGPSDSQVPDLVNECVCAHPKSVAKSMLLSEVRPGPQQAVIDAATVEMERNECDEVTALKMIRDRTRMLAETVPRERWRFFKDQQEFFRNHDYRLGPEDFMDGKGNSNGSGSAPDLISASKLREALRRESRQGNVDH